MRKVKWLVGVILGIVLVSVALCIVFSHGYLWSFREITYQHLLKSLPEPTARILETDRLDTNAYSPLGFRSYEVTGQYTETLEFFRTGVPQVGWRLLDEKENLSRPQYDDYTQGVSLLFSYQERYCLEIELRTTINTSETQGRDLVRVHMTISEEDDCHFR